MTIKEERELLECFKELKLWEKILKYKTDNYYTMILTNWFNSKMSLTESIKINERDLLKRERLEKIKLLKNDKK